jgi:drug/metabolite transporter (DMT)-like permease
MTTWIIIAIISYLLFAINGVADKFLLTKAVGNPAVYAFYVGISSVFVLALSPFGLQVIPLPLILLSLASGAAFVCALYFFYSAIKETSISRILPIEGGLVPLFTLIFAYVAGLESLTHVQLAAFGLLVAGSVLVDFKKTEKGWVPLHWHNALIAAFFFALSFILTKYVYNETNFISGLIWTRLGLVAAALSIFIFSVKTRKEISAAPHRTTTSNKVLFYVSHIAGAAASFLQNYAISLGSVVIINAMQGVQFVLILMMTIVLSRHFPNIIKEEITKPILVQKIAAIVLISGGLALLSLNL